MQNVHRLPPVATPPCPRGQVAGRSPCSPRPCRAPPAPAEPGDAAPVPLRDRKRPRQLRTARHDAPRSSTMAAALLPPHLRYKKSPTMEERSTPPPPTSHCPALSSSYLHTRYMWPKPEDVLLDRRLLADAAANNCIAAHARLIDRIPRHCADESFGFGGPLEAQPTLPDLRYHESTVCYLVLLD